MKESITRAEVVKKIKQYIDQALVMQDTGELATPEKMMVISLSAAAEELGLITRQQSDTFRKRSDPAIYATIMKGKYAGEVVILDKALCLRGPGSRVKARVYLEDSFFPDTQKEVAWENLEFEKPPSSWKST